MWSGGWGDRTRHVMAWEEPTFRKTFFSPSISLAGSEVGAHDSYPPSLCLMFLYHLYLIYFMFDPVSPTTCSCTVWLKWGTVFTCRSISFYLQRSWGIFWFPTWHSYNPESAASTAWEREEQRVNNLQQRVNNVQGTFGEQNGVGRVRVRFVKLHSIAWLYAGVYICTTRLGL